MIGKASSRKYGIWMPIVCRNSAAAIIVDCCSFLRFWEEVIECHLNQGKKFARQKHIN